MLSDKELAEEINADIDSRGGDDNPRVRNFAKKEKPIEIKGDPNRLVWVRCITDLQPWANEKPMHYWHEYQVRMEEAALLEHRRFVVILEAPEKSKK